MESSEKVETRGTRDERGLVAGFLRLTERLQVETELTSLRGTVGGPGH